MKLNIAFLGLIASQAASTPTAPPSDSPASNLAALEAECGALGVMNWDLEDLPADVDRSQLRKCREHPHDMTTLKERGILEKRWCVSHDDGGCSKSGYCWRACKKDNNSPWYKWCWLAWTDGRGDWIPCKSNKDCEPKNIGRGNCAVGDCNACGCDCSTK